ncbi:MAG: hypothetical protein AAFY06_06295, partial [Pseudomonadota bacterium]
IQHSSIVKTQRLGGGVQHVEADIMDRINHRHRCRGPRFDDRAVLDKPLKRLETLGLKTLHNATRRFAETGHVSDGLRVSYIAAELARISTLRR